MTNTPDKNQPGTDLVTVVGTEAAEAISPFVGTMFGQPSFQIGELLGDNVKWWRFKQAVKRLQKAKQLVEDAGLKPNEVPLRTLVPALEAASLENDKELCDKWSALLANATTGATRVPPGFAQVLSELEPRAARLLDDMYVSFMELASDLRFKFMVSFPPQPDETPEQLWFHVDNLSRLGLIVTGSQDVKQRYEGFNLTIFGVEFVRACRPPGTSDPPVRWDDEAALLEFIRDRDAKEAEAAEAAQAVASEDTSPAPPA